MNAGISNNVDFNPKANNLVGALTEPEFKLLAPHLELVILSSAEVLIEAYEQPKYIYFLITATASLMCWLEEGVAVEVAMVGDEGILGASALMGRNKYSFTEVRVRQPGYGYQVPIKSLERIFSRSKGRRLGILEGLISRYNQTLFIQMAQNTVCSRRHVLEQQFCTWLLSCFNGRYSDTLKMTQETIALALGFRRESITETAKKLQDAEVISYRRGYIELKSREGLEARACECSKVYKRELIRLRSDLESLHKVPSLRAAQRATF